MLRKRSELDMQISATYKPHIEIQSDTKDAKTMGFKSQPILDDDDVAKPPDVTEADWQRFLRMHEARKASNRKVSFYGRVIDQNGDPVPGVVISTEITRREESIARIIADGKDQITDKLDFITNSDGWFLIPERKGYALSIEKFTKEGYERPGRGVKVDFMFGQLLRNPQSNEFHHPDPAHPVVFTMWKKGKTEPLIATAVNLRFLEKERIDTLYLPLVLNAEAKSNPVEGWDIKARVSIRSRDDWTFTLEGNDGCGFIVTNDIHTNLAPEVGYIPSITVSSSDSDVRPDVNRSIKVYYRGRNGNKFAAFRMEFGPWGQRGENNFTIELMDLRINPNGSRNLEFDKSKRIKE
jgi:hypothetical protein